MIAEKLPIKKESLKKIESSYGIYYYDKSGGTIIDRKGTRIAITEDSDEINEQNLTIYASDLFESYYDAVAKFNRDCKFDKTEGILWG